MRTPTLLLMAALLAACALPARAQTGGPYDLSWSTLDGGGAASAGGAYAFTGTVGQPDAGSASGGAYDLSGGFWVRGIGTLDAPPAPPAAIAAFRLLPAFPNPARGATTIAFELPDDQDVRVEVFDIAGHRLRELLAGRRPAGVHRVRWDGTSDDGHPLPAGMYFTHVTAGPRSATAKLVLLDPTGGAR